MENKKNYIDGVDVSGCNNIDEWKHCNICQVLIKTIPNRHQCLTEGDLRCEFYPDCYYKQLKRLEQERNEWKKKYEDAANENLLEIYELIKKNDAWRGIVNVVNGKLEQENAELKAENERLKEENYQLQKDCQICENFIDFIPCKPIRDMDYDLQKVISQRDNYYQALQKIIEICKNSIHQQMKIFIERQIKYKTKSTKL